MRREMNPRLPKIIAHRGGRRWAPENTMAAFRNSLGAGVYGIELDIHRCRSGELVVIHDHDLTRTTDGVGLIKDRSYLELERLSAGLWFDKKFGDERIPRLKDVLDLVAGRCVLNIEIKNCPVDYPGIAEDLIELLSHYRRTDMLIISSFDHQILKRIHAQAPDLPLALLAEAIFVDVAQYARAVGTTAWHPGFASLRADAVSEAQAQGLVVNAWTLNDKDQWLAALSMQLDGIITDDPLGLKQFLSTAQALRAGTS